jgi:hypothetical protein
MAMRNKQNSAAGMANSDGVVSEEISRSDNGKLKPGDASSRGEPGGRIRLGASSCIMSIINGKCNSSKGYCDGLIMILRRAADAACIDVANRRYRGNEL